MVGSKVSPRHDTLAFWTGVTELLRALQEPCTWPACETGGGNPILGTSPKSPSSPGTDPQPRDQSTCNYKEHHRGARTIPRCWGCGWSSQHRFLQGFHSEMNSRCTKRQEDRLGGVEGNQPEGKREYSASTLNS